MPVEFRIVDDNHLTLRISGELGIDEFRRVQADMETAVQKQGSVKLLILLDSFSGWEQADGWEDLSFMERNDRFMEKMAIVGDDKWRDLAYAFTLKGLRSVPIEYFTPDAEASARRWLGWAVT